MRLSLHCPKVDHSTWSVPQCLSGSLARPPRKSPYSHPDILAAETALLDGLANLFLIAIGLRRVKMVKAGVEGCLDVSDGGLSWWMSKPIGAATHEKPTSVGIFQVPQ